MSTPYKNLTDQGANTNAPPPQPRVNVGIVRDTTSAPRVNVGGSQQSGDIGWPNPDPNPGPKPMRVR